MAEQRIDHGDACPRCFGDGEVMCNDSPLGDPQTAYPGTCPDCLGDGVDPRARALEQITERLAA
jgi:DnaJ-class molecular chaperone